MIKDILRRLLIKNNLEFNIPKFINKHSFKNLKNFNKINQYTAQDESLLGIGTDEKIK